MSNAFKSSVVIALDNIQLQTALDRGTTRAVNGRIAAMGETATAPELRALARAARPSSSINPSKSAAPEAACAIVSIGCRYHKRFSARKQACAARRRAE